MAVYFLVMNSKRCSTRNVEEDCCPFVSRYTTFASSNLPQFLHVHPGCRQPIFALRYCKFLQLGYSTVPGSPVIPLRLFRCVRLDQMYNVG